MSHDEKHIFIDEAISGSTINRPGLQALEKALDKRLYAAINKQSIERKEGKLIFKMNECRVQTTRKKKGLPDFPCKGVVSS